MNTEPIRPMNAAITSSSPHLPKVSIGMPVYNGEPFIREALDSLLAQTFTDFELIISDNASTDGTEVICREYATNDARIRYVRQTVNRGPTANFQFVLYQAVGEYFMWAAADDHRHEDFVSLAVRVLSEASNVGLVFTSMETKDLLSGSVTLSSTGFTTSQRKFLRVVYRLSQPCPSLIYGLYRKETLDKLSLKKMDYFDLFVPLWFELNSNIRIIPLNLYSAGTSGVRIPYSITGRLIDPSGYLKEAGRLFEDNLGIFAAILLKLVNWFLIIKNAKISNSLINPGKCR